MFAIVVSIFLHELGHFIVAKRAGMKVTEFFIGFGPRIWSFRRGETEYGVKVLPAGAYVRIIGMHNLEEVDPADEARTYRAQPYRKRLPVVLAGPFANFVIAFVLLFVIFVGWGTPNLNKWTVDRVVAGSAADQAGLQQGDRIVSFNGQARRRLRRVERPDRRRRRASRSRSRYVRDGEQTHHEHAARVAPVRRLRPRRSPPLRSGDQILVGQRPGRHDLRRASPPSWARPTPGTAAVVFDRQGYRYETAGRPRRPRCRPTATAASSASGPRCRASG